MASTVLYLHSPLLSVLLCFSALTNFLVAKKEATKDKPKKAAVKGGKKKTTRAKKDPNAPKRAKSAYMYFCEANREVVKKDKPDLKQPQILSELGKRWKEVTDSDKKQYEEKAAKDKERYAKEKAAYEKNGGGKKKAKKESDSEDEESNKSEDDEDDDDDDDDDE